MMPLARSAEDTAAQQTKQKKKDDKNLKQQHDMFCLCLSVVYDRHIIYIYTHTTVQYLRWIPRLILCELFV